MVTGTGNLVLAKTQDMAFEMAGTVDQIGVKAGDIVKKGQELARLDKSVWESQIKAQNKALTSAQRALTSVQGAVTNAQRNVLNTQNSLVTMQNNLAKAQRAVGTKQMAVTQAQLNLASAQNSIANIQDIKTAQDKIDQLQMSLDNANSMLARAGQANSGIDASYWRALVNGDTNSQTGKPNSNGLIGQIAQAKKDLQDILSGSSASVTKDVALQVSQTEFNLQQSQRALEDAQIAVQDAQTAVSSAQTAVDNAKLDIDDAQQKVSDTRQSVSDAQQNVADAQSALDDLQALNPIILAPFDGFITKVNSLGGDLVQKGTIAMQVADPNQFQANIMVGERDIFSVKIGGNANVSLDALSGNSFPAQITTIAPLATVQQGVVNYQVTVELTSLTPLLASGTLGATGRSALPTVQGSFQGRNPSVVSGNNSTSATGNRTLTGAGAFAGFTQSPMTLKPGLSATVNIVTQEKDNILLVPNRAVSRQGRNSVVQVVTGTATEARTVQTGISDSNYTEVISGLNEGEQVSISSGTAATPTNNNRPGGVPGLGGGIRIGG